MLRRVERFSISSKMLKLEAQYLDRKLCKYCDYKITQTR